MIQKILFDSVFRPPPSDILFRIYFPVTVYNCTLKLALNQAPNIIKKIKNAQLTHPLPPITLPTYPLLELPLAQPQPLARPFGAEAVHPCPQTSLRAKSAASASRRSRLPADCITEPAPNCLARASPPASRGGVAISRSIGGFLARIAKSARGGCVRSRRDAIGRLRQRLKLALTNRRRRRRVLKAAAAEEVRDLRVHFARAPPNCGGDRLK